MTTIPKPGTRVLVPAVVESLGHDDEHIIVKVGGRPAQVPVAAATPRPVKVTFVLWDEDTDGVAVKHDGEIVWQETSLAHIDQYLRFTAPRGVPVTIEIEEG